MKVFKLNFEDILKVVKENGFTTSVQLSSKDGNKVLVREKVKMMYDFAIISQDKNVRIKELFKDRHPMYWYDELVSAREFLRRFQLVDLTETNIQKIINKYPESVRISSGRGGIKVVVEINKSLNLAQIWRNKSVLNIDENHESFAELEAKGKLKEAREFRKKITEIAGSLGDRFGNTWPERFLGRRRHSRPIDKVWLVASTQFL